MGRLTNNKTESMTRKQELDILIPYVREEILNTALKVQQCNRNIDKSHISALKKRIRTLEKYTTEYKNEVTN